MSKQTIASWIVNVIKLAYDESDVNIRAHSTRAIGPSLALFKGASITSILEAADWSSDATFKKYYYREMDSRLGVLRCVYRVFISSGFLRIELIFSVFSMILYVIMEVNEG